MVIAIQALYLMSCLPFLVANGLTQSVCLPVYENGCSCFRIVSEDMPARISPYFDVMALKEFMMQLLAEAVENGGAHIRDPIGGTNSSLFV